MGASDELLRGRSTFMVEMSELGEILRTSTSRSLLILDEIGRGTSTHDGTAIAEAALEYIVRETNAVTVFVTHFPLIGQLARVRCSLSFHLRYEILT
jgi:DNA mismatch repair protein MSH3